MILSAEHVRLIRLGKKTEHRIPVVEPRARKPGEHPGFGNQPHVGQVIPISVRQRVDGRLVAVPQCTVTVTSYRRATLGASLNTLAVHAEGHRTTDDYKTWWVTEHDRAWCGRTIDPGRWFTAPYGTATADRRLDQLEAVLEPDLIARFDARHRDRAVWVIACEPEPVAPDRFIALDNRGDERGYTTRPEMAVRDIPPAVDEATQRRISDKGREYDALRAAGAAEHDLDILRGLDSAIVEMKALGLRTGVNLRDQIKAQQQVRNGVERKIRDQAARRRQAAA